MVKRISLIFVLIITFSANLFSQTGGQGVYQFLDLVSSARQTAIGGRVVSYKDSDVNFAIWNPASLNSKMDGQIALNYVDYFSDINYGSAFYAREFEDLGTFFTGVNYVDYGEFTRSSLGEDEGTFSASDVALYLGYSYELDSLLSFGANLKVINSSYDIWNSFGLAFDLGASYYIPSKNIYLGLVVRNIGAQITSYSGHEREKLPIEVVFGISQELEHLPLRWNVSFENLQTWNIAFSNPSFAQTDLDGNVKEEKIGFADNLLRHIVIGAELFPEGNFSARLSYNFRRGAEMKLASYNYYGGISFGFGMKVKKFRINYTRSLYHPAGGTNNFSITTDLNAF